MIKTKYLTKCIPVTVVLYYFPTLPPLYGTFYKSVEYRPFFFWRGICPIDLALVVVCEKCFFSLHFQKIADRSLF